MRRFSEIPLRSSAQSRSPTAEELEPLMVEIVDGAGEVVTTIQTGEDGAFSYDPGSLEETGPRTLTARVRNRNS